MTVIDRRRVAILLTSCERREYLREAIESVLAQTFTDYWMLIVDDASTDGSAELALDYARRFPERIRVIVKPSRRGYVDSVNLGLDQLRGSEYVALHNDDDRWHPRKLEAQMRAFAENPTAGLVATEAWLINRNGDRTGEKFSDITALPQPERAAHDLFRIDTFCAPSVVISAQGLRLISHYGTPDGGCNDWWMWLTIASELPVVWLPDPLTEYRQWTSQMSSVRELEMRYEGYRLRADAYDRSPAIRQAVGGKVARRTLDYEALYYASWHLRRRQFSAGWRFAALLLQRPSPGLLARLIYHLVPALVAATAGGDTPEPDPLLEDAAVAEHSRTAELFAERYEALERDPYRSAFTYSRMRLGAILASHLPSEGAGARLLDVGCGTGHQVAELRQRGFTVAGVDGSGSMLDHARKLNPGADLRLADVASLPFADADFDFVICLEVVRYLPDPLPCLREIRRVLKPGGIALVTATPLFNLNGYAIVNRVALALPQRSLTRLRQFFYTPTRLRARFRQAGFAEAELHGVYLGPLNWAERLAPAHAPQVLRRWHPIDEALADRPVLRDLSNMYLVCARA